MTSGVTLASGVTAGPGEPVILLQNAAPLILVSSGNIGNNGALTAITALDLAFGNCWMNFPAGAVAAGVPATSTTLFVQMTGVTAGTVFNNSPQIVGNTIPFPTTPTPFVTTGPGAYVQTTASQITLLTIPLQGGVIGAFGRLHANGLVSNNNSAGAKTAQLGWTAGGPTLSPTANTTNRSASFDHNYMNIGITNAQVACGGNGFGTPAAAPIRGTLDTTTAFNFILQAQLATATDWIQYDLFVLEAFP